jgi:hypothetical protein
MSSLFSSLLFSLISSLLFFSHLISSFSSHLMSSISTPLRRSLTVQPVHPEALGLLGEILGEDCLFVSSGFKSYSSGENAVDALSHLYRAR